MWKLVRLGCRTYCSQHLINKFETELFSLLNECNVESLSSRNVTKTEITNLQSWIRENGPIQSISNLLEVKGWNSKVVQKIAKTFEDATSTTTNKLKSIRQFISPNLTVDELVRISSPVALQVTVSGISWAKLCRNENALLQWNYYAFPDNAKRYSSVDTYYLAYSILKKIPLGDIYIFEAPANMSPQSKKPPAAIVSYNQLMELSSMLLALINTSPTHNICDKINDEYVNTVYYLKARVPARLFGTLLGSERIASTTVVSKLLDDRTDKQLPCSPITVSDTLKNYYFSQNGVDGEGMGQVLLLALAFMNVCVYQNPTSISIISPRKKSA